MSALRAIAIILSLSIISTSSAPIGIEFGLKSKVYFGNNREIQIPLPTFHIRLPSFNQQPPPNNPLKGLLEMLNNGNRDKESQQPFFAVPPQAMDMLLALIQPLLDLNLEQQNN